MTARTGLELRSTITAGGELRLELEEVTVRDPGPDEVVIQVEAAPINPSDLGLLIGPADLSTMHGSGTPERPVITAQVPTKRLAAVAARLDQSLAVGNEGAGTVVAAGVNATHLLGKRVGAMGLAMYAEYCVVPASGCSVLPDGGTAADGAAMFVNPLTALSMIETMRSEGHTAIVHTAAASTLGQMLLRVCLADGIDVVAIVRSPEQVALLRKAGATHVLDSKAEDFDEALADAITTTGATIAFDAIGGGTLAGQILHAMEVGINRRGDGTYSRYGSDAKKQVYIYGGLDPSPTVLTRTFGMSWSCGGWLLMPFLAAAGPQVEQRLRQRVVDELTTLFASDYAHRITLTEALQPEVLAKYVRKQTGEKYLIVSPD